MFDTQFLSQQQQEQLNVFQHVVLEKNNVLNLTAIRDTTQFYRKHILDSLACHLAWQHTKTPKKIIDVGTGAGFPGIVLAIAYPDTTVTLVESIQKKYIFLQEVKQLLSLVNVTIIHQRAEHLQHDRDHKQQYDVAVSRAVASLEILIPLLLPFIHKKGMVIAMKGQKAEEEIVQAQQVLKQYQLTVQQKISYLLPEETMERKLLVVQHPFLS